MSISDNIVSVVSSCNYLGVQIDDNLSFKGHINGVISKISKHKGILYRIRCNLPLKARLNYYYSFIYPYLTYGVIVWGDTFSTLINKLIVQHKRTIRVLAELPYNDHTSQSFHDLELLKFNDIYKYYISIYMFKNKNHSRFQTIHSINTRYCHLAQPSFNRLSICQNSVYYKGPHIWNNLPDQICNITSLSLFKRTLKKYFIDSYT